uniref:Succinyl-CoA:glutarate-CoA transferase n=1 Tax=Neolamprologus brichardi TaxID=32507 RepID=A0A3Q4IBQ6_NEOBR
SLCLTAQSSQHFLTCGIFSHFPLFSGWSLRVFPNIAVDLKHPRGAQIVQQLAGVCDVLLENYVPGKLRQMGLGYEQLSVSEAPLKGGSRRWGGQSGKIERIGSTHSSHMIQGLWNGGDPVRPGVAMTDLATGLYAHGAVMAALLQRQKTGRGVHIDCNLLSSQVKPPDDEPISSQYSPQVLKRMFLSCCVFFFQGFKTKDGHLVVGAGNEKQFVRVCQCLMFVTLLFLQVKHNRLVQEMNHPTAGRIAVVGPAVRFSSFSPSGPTPPPLIGQHTVEVLRDVLSYSKEVIETLLESKAVVQNEVF